MMIDLVLPETRFGFASALMEMHRDRKHVFVDRLGWRLPAMGSWLEIDEFDNEYAVYLLARSPEGRHQGSVRLLPSSRPHMLGSLFNHLCPEGVPGGDDCWEISRLVTNPEGAAGTSLLKVHRMLALALVEFATLNNISRYTLVAEAHRVPALLSIGWQVVPLGLPSRCGSEELQALQIDVTAETLADLRGRLGFSTPVLRVEVSAEGRA
jgi:N-acyl-L-homoserine lactone synthetase